MEELFNGQLSFADIEAEKFLQIRRSHADRRVNAMDRLTDNVINELIQLCLPLYHIKASQGRPYTRLETMVRIHLLQVSLNLSDLEMESYLASDMVARSFCRVSSTHLFISDSTILRFRHFIEQHGLAQKFLERTVNLAAEAGACSFDMVAADGTFIEAPSSTKNIYMVSSLIARVKSCFLGIGIPEGAQPKRAPSFNSVAKPHPVETLIDCLKLRRRELAHE